MEKLPSSLQEKWLYAGSRFKEENKVSFPPFLFFTHFVCSEAEARNDSSFKFSNSSYTVVRNERSLFKHGASKVPVLVHKTDVSKNDESDSVSLKEIVKKDSTKHCPIHNKSYPLWKCRAFGKKSLVECKNLLKEHKRCFRCCSLNHVARECLVVLKCAECDSDIHGTVMHPDIALPLFTPPM